MASIHTQIIFRYADGETIMSFTEYESLLHLGLQENSELKNWRIEIGKNINIKGNDYKIVNVLTIVHGQMMTNTSEEGINFYVVGERYDFNLEIVYTIESID